MPSLVHPQEEEDCKVLLGESITRIWEHGLSTSRYPDYYLPTVLRVLNKANGERIHFEQLVTEKYDVTGADIDAVDTFAADVDALYPLGVGQTPIWDEMSLQERHMHNLRTVLLRLTEIEAAAHTNLEARAGIDLWLRANDPDASGRSRAELEDCIVQHIEDTMLAWNVAAPVSDEIYNEVSACKMRLFRWAAERA